MRDTQDVSDEEVDAAINQATADVLARAEKTPNRQERRSQKRGGRYSSYERSLWRRFADNTGAKR